MGARYVIVAVIASAITVFALQNNEPVSVRLLAWSLSLPLASVILMSVASGIVIVGLPLWFDRWRLRSRTRALEDRLAAADAQRAAALRAETERRTPPSPERSRDS
ncbi:MAG: LapA family protein [Candidatus Rokubacteria bacterium]|nr:LapA family protein [Candidatus Rokubacteria bacterium]